MKWICAIVLMITLAFVGCAAKDEDIPVGEVDYKKSKDWVIETFEAPNLHLKRPMGITTLDDYVLICDADANDIVVFDKNLNFVQRIGTLGINQGEFIFPSNIQTYNNDLYVLDTGNNRVQVLDSEYNFKNEYKLLSLNSQQGDFYKDMQVLSPEHFYFTTVSFGENADIFEFNNNEISSLGNTFWGCIENTGEKMFAINTLQIIDNSNSNFSAVSGENFLYTIEHDKIEEKCSLPNKYTIADFEIIENEIYALSTFWHRIDKFTLDGEYIETIAELDELNYDAFMTVDENNIFYVTDSKKLKVYKITKKDG